MFFQIEDDGGIGGKWTCVRRIIKLLNNFVILFGLRKQKRKILVYSSELYLVFGSINSTQRIKKNLTTFIVDHGY